MDISKNKMTCGRFVHDANNNIRTDDVCGGLSTICGRLIIEGTTHSFGNEHKEWKVQTNKWL